MARVDPARGKARRVDGLGDVGRVAARSRRRPRAGARACARSDPTCPSSPIRPCTPGRGRWCRTSSRRSRTRCGCRRCRRSDRARWARSAPGSATRRWRSACSPGSRSTRPRPRTRCGSSVAPPRLGTGVGDAFDAGPDQVLALLEAEGGHRRARDFLAAVRPVPVRLRLAGPERVRPACAIVGGQAAHRARRDRPDAQVRRRAGARHPPRRRRSSSAIGWLPRSARRSPATRRPRACSRPRCGRRSCSWPVASGPRPTA